MPEITAAATFCATLVDEWVRSGVQHAVVAPGSRSTPLALALAAEERLTLHVHHDERSAGFVALGIGASTETPAVVLTTSGTAAAELHPAVVEAHEAGVPMLVCTADRPPELRDVGAPQTIDQTHLYGRAVRWFADPGVPDGDQADSWRSLAARAALEATGRRLGPVHLNLPFREPLTGDPGPLPSGRADGRAWHRRWGGSVPLDDAGADEVIDLLRGRRGVIVAGAAALWPGAVEELAIRLGWPVLAGPRSGAWRPNPSVVTHADAFLRSHADAGPDHPEVILRLGPPPASRVIAEWLAAAEATEIAALPPGTFHDPSHRVDVVAETSATMLVSAILNRFAPEPVDPAWLESWLAAERAAEQAIADVLDRHPEPTEPAIARDVVSAVPDGGALMVASSMPIRDVEWYASPRDGIRVVANRGANGIDGVVSTAVGLALGTERPVVALVGDVAFLHDANALVGLADREVEVTVVVVDNDGGGIFSFLPQAETLPGDRFEQLFGTPHGVDVAAVAAAYGLEADVLETQAEVGPAVAKGGTRVLVARTDRAANVAVHDEIHAAVRAARSR